MKSKVATGVLRRNGRLPPSSFRYYPYDTGSGFGKEDMKQEVVRLGTEFSLCVAQTMFLLSDDIRTMFWFCAKLWSGVMCYQNPVLERLLRVMHYVYSRDIKPKNRVFRDDGNSVQWEFVRTTWDDFVQGILVLNRFALALGRNDYSFDDRLLSTAIAKYKLQVLKKLKDKLTCVNDVSEANGFARETMVSIISDLWKSLFNEDDAGDAAAAKVITNRILADLFTPILGNPFHTEILHLAPFSPYILGEDFAKQELKQEVVQLGVELSLYVAQSMLLLCDDIPSMLWFCFNLWGDAKRDQNPDSPVVERLLTVIHYVYSKHIIPKNAANHHNNGKSVHHGLITATKDSFDAVIRDLDGLVLILRGEGSCLAGREFTSRIEQALKKVNEKLKSVSEANEFARDAMESSILDLWKPIFGKEAKKVIKYAG